MRNGALFEPFLDPAVQAALAQRVINPRLALGTEPFSELLIIVLGDNAIALGQFFPYCMNAGNIVSFSMRRGQEEPEEKEGLNVGFLKAMSILKSDVDSLGDRVHEWTSNKR